MDAVLALLERLEMPFHIADALERNSFIEFSRNHTPVV